MGSHYARKNIGNKASHFFSNVTALTTTKKYRSHLFQFTQPILNKFHDHIVSLTNNNVPLSYVHDHVQVASYIQFSLSKLSIQIL